MKTPTIKSATHGTPAPGFIAGYLSEHPEHADFLRAILASSEQGKRAVAEWQQSRRPAA